MSMLRIVFAGTPAFAVPALQTLIDDPLVNLVAVYTQPDRPAGRGRHLSASPVKEVALAAGVTVEQPSSWKTQDVIEGFASFEPDLLVVAAYGVILPEASLQVPSLGAINVHASLLPRWRGAAPIQRALMAGDRVTGITIMRVVKALDAGPMLLKRECEISDQETSGSLEAKLARLGAEALAAALGDIRHGRVTAEAQDESRVTYAAKITRADRDLDWQQPAQVLERWVRALFPSPLAFTDTLGLPLNILRAHVLDADPGAEPGTIIRCGPEGLDVATGRGQLRLLEVQPPGKRPMPIKDFLNGYGTKLLFHGSR